MQQQASFVGKNFVRSHLYKHTAALRPHLIRLSAFALYQAGTLCVVVTTLLVWPYLGRVLNQSQVGEISFNLAIASISAPALALGAHLYLANKLASTGSQGGAVEARTALSLASGLYLLAVAALCGDFLIADQSLLVPLSLSSASAAYLVTAGVARGLNRPAIFGACALVVQVVGLLGLGLGAAATGDLRFGVLVYVAMVAMPVVLQYIVLRARLGPVRWALVGGTLRAALRLVPHLVLAVALLTMMRILVALQLGNEAAANYTFASLIIGGSITIGASLDAHWSVRAQAASSIEALNGELSRNQNKTQLLLLIAAIAVICFLFVGLPLWLPQGYDSNGVALAVLCALPAASLQAVADGRAAVLMWMDRPGLVSVSTAIGTLITILLAYLFLPHFGWPALGLVLTVGFFFRALATSLFARTINPESRVGSKNIIFLAAQFVLAITFLTLTGSVSTIFLTRE